MAARRQPTIRILSGDLEGTYSLRWPMTQGDWEVVWKIANVGMLEFPDEIGRGNPLVNRALMTLALEQSGRVIAPGMLDYVDPLSGVEMLFPEPEVETQADGSPLVETSDSAESANVSDNGSPIGESSSLSLAISPDNATELDSGSPGLGQDLVSDQTTSPV